MLCIGEHIPSLRTPAFRQGALALFDFSEYRNHWLALCALPGVEPTEAAILDYHHDTFYGDGALLLALCPTALILHTPWIRQTPTLRTLVLTDPLSRLHRLLNLPREQRQDRCFSVLIDPSGFLRIRLVHPLTGHGMGTLTEALLANQRLPRPLGRKCDYSKEKGAFVSCNL